MRLISTLGLTFLLLSSAAQAQRVYTWTDANGQKHFSSSPPPGQKTDRVRIRKAPDAPPVPASEEKKTDDAAKPVLSDARKAELTSYCREMRRQIATLSAGGNLSERTADGKESPLSQAQINQGLADRRANVEANCTANGM
jgi:hypothetical protein